MRLSLFSQAIRTLFGNKLRSILTMFGISWGIFSIILMTSVGEGFIVGQKEAAATLGTDIIIIWGGKTSMQSDQGQMGRDIRLDYSDCVEIRKKSRYIKTISAELMKWDVTVRSRHNAGSIDIRGIEPPYQFMRMVVADKGRVINHSDEEQRRQVAIIGSEVNDQLFDGANSLGEEIRIGDHTFTVVGILPYKEMNSNYSGQDHSDIFIPYQTMKKLFPHPRAAAGKDSINNLIAVPHRHEDWEIAEEEIRKILGEKKRFHPDDHDAMSIWNTGEGLEFTVRLFRTTQIFMGAVGIVTVLLGALGITNIMLVTVRERTSEIGLRKALGAKPRDIMFQFISEAMTLTFIAGIAGLALIFSLAWFVNSLPMPVMFGGLIISSTIAWSVVLILSISGIISGIYPAYIAAKMDPIEALRWEAA
jgi:putative ABC transport system permease protein